MRFSKTAFAVKVRFDVPESDPLMAMLPDDEESELLGDATETFPLNVWQFVVETQDWTIIFAAVTFIAISLLFWPTELANETVPEPAFIERFPGTDDGLT